MSNVVIDNTQLFATKMDKPGEPVPTGQALLESFVSADANQHRTWLSDIRDFVGGYIAGFFRGKHNPSPPTPASDEYVVHSNNGQMHLAERGFPAVWIKTLDYVNAGDSRFGLNGGGTVDDAAALSAAIQATVAASSSNKKGCLILPSDVQIRIASAVTVGAALGFNMEGTGVDSSQIIVDPTTPNDNGLVINSSERARLSGFAILCKQSNPAGTALLFDFNPFVNNSNQHKLSDLWISLAQGSMLSCQYGISFSNAHGENSEVQYQNVIIEGFSEAGIYLPGTQQYGHVGHNVQLNGRWDGVDHLANGGKFGIKANGGSFQFSKSGIGACRGAAFCALLETAPLVIHGIDMENNYQLFGNGTPSSGMSGSSALQEVEIAFCRFDSSEVPFDDTGIIQVIGIGTFSIHGNTFYGGDGTKGQTLIAFAPGNVPRGNEIRRNQFLTTNSVSVDPIVVYGTALNYRQCIDADDNAFTDASGNLGYRDETLNRASTAGTYYAGGANALGVHQDMYGIDLTTFKAASASQTIAMPQTQPKGFTYEEFRAHLYNYAVVTGGATLSMRIGTTSGGDELLQDVTVGGSGSGDDSDWYGDDPTQRGTMLQSSGGHMPNGGGTSQVFVTVTASSGNLGDGTTSNITRGQIHCPVKYSLQPRFVP